MGTRWLWTLWIGVPGSAALIGLFAAVELGAYRTERRLNAAALLWARGDAEGARSTLLGLTKHWAPLAKASAYLQLATQAFHEGDVPAARAHVDAPTGSRS